jgi:intracellular septation protein A
MTGECFSCYKLLSSNYSNLSCLRARFRHSSRPKKKNILFFWLILCLCSREAFFLENTAITTTLALTTQHKKAFKKDEFGSVLGRNVSLYLVEAYERVELKSKWQLLFIFVRNITHNVVCMLGGRTWVTFKSKNAPRGIFLWFFSYPIFILIKWSIETRTWTLFETFI